MSSIKSGALVVSWAAVVPGRETQMLEVLMNVLAYANQLVADGRIEDVRFYVSTTGPNRDTLMLLGSTERLAQLLIDDEFESHLQEGMMVVRDINVALWAGGRPEVVMDGLAAHAQKLQMHGLA